MFEDFLETFACLHTSSRGRKIAGWLCSPIDFYENFFIEAKLSFEGQTRNDIEIFSNCQRRVEQSDPQQDITPHRHRLQIPVRMFQMIHDCTKGALDSHERAHAESFQYRVREMCMAYTARMNIDCVGDEGDNIRIRPNVFQLASQIVLLPLIVRIEKSYLFTIGIAYSSISRCTNTTIRLMQDRYFSPYR